MARKPRIEYEGALYHVITRGNQSYTMYFNRRHTTVVHLFQGRYKAILCDQDSYLLSLVKYIHMNPIRVRVAKTLDAYPWSSHESYVWETKAGAIVDTELVLKMFSEDLKKARRSYREYMGQKEVLRREEVYATVDQRILGNEGFVEKVIAKTGRRDVRRKGRHALLRKNSNKQV